MIELYPNMLQILECSDRLGSLIRRVGVISDSVYLVTGGYVLPLSDLGIPLKL